MKKTILTIIGKIQKIKPKENMIFLKTKYSRDPICITNVHDDFRIDPFSDNELEVTGEFYLDDKGNPSSLSSLTELKIKEKTKKQSVLFSVLLTIMLLTTFNAQSAEIVDKKNISMLHADEQFTDLSCQRKHETVNSMTSQCFNSLDKCQDNLLKTMMYNRNLSPIEIENLKRENERLKEENDLLSRQVIYWKQSVDRMKEWQDTNCIKEVK